MLFSDDEWPGSKNLAHSPAVWRRMFEDIHARGFGLSSRPFHLVWQMMKPVEPLWEFADRIFHVHAKDVQVYPRRLADVGILAYHHATTPPSSPDSATSTGVTSWPCWRRSATGDPSVEVEDRAYEGSLADRQRALDETTPTYASSSPRRSRS